MSHRIFARKERMVTACALFAAFVCSMSLANAGEQQTWAIISCDARTDAHADALTAELSNANNIQLVERAQVQTVFDELKLSAAGLATGKQVVQFGRIVQAKSLILLSPSNEKQPSDQPSIRVRLIDARNSIRLLDLAFAGKEFDDQVSFIGKRLIERSQVLNLPPDRVQMLSISRIVSGEPGTYLRPLCRTLNTLVASALQQQPCVIVLEREDLDRLVSERDTSGLDLDFKAAARVVEISITRSENNRGLTARCRIANPATSNVQVINVSTDTQDPIQLRDELTSKLLGAAAEKPRVKDANALEKEATLFERRAKQFRGAYRPIEAAEFMDAACILSPTRERLGHAGPYFSSAIREQFKQKKYIESMLLRRRQIELSLEEERLFPSDIVFYAGKIQDRYGRLPPRGGVSSMEHTRYSNTEEIEIYHDIVETKRAIFQNQLKRAGDNPTNQFTARMRQLDLEIGIARESGRLQSAVSLFDKLFELTQAKEIGDDVSNELYRRLITRMLIVTYKIQEADRKHGWERSDRSAWIAKSKSYNPKIGRLIELVLSLDRRNRNSPQSARSILNLLNDDKENLNRIASLDSIVRSPALSYLTRDEQHAYWNEVIQRCESSNDCTEVLWHAMSVGRSLTRLEPAQAKALSVRITTLLPEFSYHKSGFIRDFTKYHREKIALEMRNVLTRWAGVPQYVRPNEGSPLAGATGAWLEYTARPIKILTDDRNFSAAEIYVDRNPNAKQLGGELILVYSGPAKGMLIYRLSASGGKLTQIGPHIPGHRKAFRRVPVEFSPDAMYVASDKPGFYRVVGNELEHFGESDGAPASEVLKLTWFRGLLYVAYKDAFATFNPKDNSFRLIASATSAEARNPLDARGSFFIRQLIADEANDCLWITIQDNALPRDRNGFWKYEPSKPSFKKISGGNAWVSPVDNKIMINRSSADASRAFYDPAKDKLAAIAAFKDIPPVRSAAELLIQVDEHFINTYGKLTTSKGEQFKLPGRTQWKSLTPFGKGFITHFDRKEKCIWYIERKAP